MANKLAVVSLHEVEQHAPQVAKLLKAVANPQRLLILCRLLGREMSVGELNGILTLSQSALSQHLALTAGGDTKKYPECVFSVE